ncbi:MAG: class I SAM-dependent methyltransferase [Longimicrobiales bacterium]|nr:class I SAM-dependent methyltransferase [Longimicrobiales bacterium]
MTTGQGEGGPDGAARIDAHYYDSTTYFEAAPHLLDRESAFQRYRIRMVTRLAGPRATDRVVDLGCGWGTFEFALSEQVREIVGVDFSRRSIEFCRRELARTPRSNVSFLCADAGHTGLEGESVDLVVAADLFEHLYPEDAQRVAAEAYRILRPGGRFAVWTPHRGHLLEVLKSRGIVLRPDPTHVDYKSMARMRQLLTGVGFGIGTAYYAESHLPVLRTAERLLGRWVPLLRRRIALLGVKPGHAEPGGDARGTGA